MTKVSMNSQQNRSGLQASRYQYQHEQQQQQHQGLDHRSTKEKM